MGTWVADDGKTVVITPHGRGFTVTVRPGPGLDPCTSAELLDGGTKLIEDLPAQCHLRDGRVRYLEIEAGTPGLGPTYRLYATVQPPQGPRPAKPWIPARRIVLVPSPSIGLYDDWDDDLGVPWAYPLLPLTRQTATRR